MVLFLAIASPAIAKQNKHKKKSKPGNQLISVAMRRTGCFGKCPAYIIDVNKSGVATYTGIRFTEDSGAFEKNIGTKKVAEIFDEVIADRIDTCKNEYVNRMTDLPGLIFTIKYADSTKTITNANYGPLVLKHLTDAMAALAGKKLDGTWKRK